MQRTNQCSIPKQKLLCQYICPVSLWWFIWRYAREDNLQCWLRLEIKQRYLFCFLLKVWNRDTSKARVTEKSYRVLREARTGDCLTRGQFWTLWSRNYGTKQIPPPVDGDQKAIVICCTGIWYAFLSLIIFASLWVIYIWLELIVSSLVFRLTLLSCSLSVYI